MSHALHDAISLEIARRVSLRLLASPALIELAHSNLASWSERNADAPSLLRCYEEWRDILTRPLPEIIEILCAETESGQRLARIPPLPAYWPRPKSGPSNPKSAGAMHRTNPDYSDLIDGSIGEGSPFHQSFDYYPHGVGRETATLPEGWRDRLVPVHNPNTGGGTGLCLEPHDLAVAKLVAGREKDLVFVAGLVRHRLVEVPTVRERLARTELDEGRRAVCEARLRAAIDSSA